MADHISLGIYVLVEAMFRGLVRKGIISEQEIVGLINEGTRYRADSAGNIPPYVMQARDEALKMIDALKATK
jgi:hypothetical protein